MLSNIFKTPNLFKESSNTLLNRGVSNSTLNEVSKRLKKSTIESENAPQYLMYFLHNGFSGNHQLLGFAFLVYYLEKKENKTLNDIFRNPNEIYKNYFANADQVKAILLYYVNDFYPAFLRLFNITVNAAGAPPVSMDQDLKNMDTRFQNLL